MPLLCLGYGCVKIQFLELPGLGEGPPGWGTPVTFTVPSHPVCGGHRSPLHMGQAVEEVGEPRALQCISYYFNLRDLSLKR